MSQYSSPDNDAFIGAVAVQDSTWYTIPALNRSLGQLRIIDVSLQTGRTQALGILNSLMDTSPYIIDDGTSEHDGARRFGAVGTTIMSARIFLAAFAYGWPELFASLRGAASFRDRQSEKAMLDNGGILEVDQSRSTPDPSQMRSQYNDSLVSFQKTISTMECMIRNRVGVHNYKTFETEMTLVWSTTPPSALDTLSLLQLPQLPTFGDPNVPPSFFRQSPTEMVRSLRQPSTVPADLPPAIPAVQHTHFTPDIVQQIVDVYDADDEKPAADIVRGVLERTKLPMHRALVDRGLFKTSAENRRLIINLILDVAPP